MTGDASLRGVSSRGAWLGWPRRRPAATVYTGDVIQGKRVISQLDVADLEPGKKHSFYFQGVQMGTGQHWYLPVVVAKGAKPGKRILLISGVHGDEVSPVDAVQRTMAQLDPAHDVGHGDGGVRRVAAGQGGARRACGRSRNGAGS